MSRLSVHQKLLRAQSSGDKARADVKRMLAPSFSTTARARGDWQGMNWIRQEKRLAIYLRDGCACVWCGAKVEDGVRLTLDHVVPHIKGGDNESTNLVTACKRCNDSRGARSATKFAEVTAAYINHGVLAKRILGHVMTQMYKSLEPFMLEAKQLIARRGSAFAALNGRQS